MIYICTKLREKKGLKFIERAQFPLLKFSKGHNSSKKVAEVMVIVLCILSNDALYLYQVS